MISTEELNKRKEQIIYQINAIRPYMSVDGHDEFLDDEWKKLQSELQILQNKLQSLEKQLAPLTKRKQQVQYLINSVGKYMTVDGHDEFLKQEWNKLTKELEEIEDHMNKI